MSDSLNSCQRSRPSVAPQCNRRARVAEPSRAIASVLPARLGATRRPRRPFRSHGEPPKRRMTCTNAHSPQLRITGSRVWGTEGPGFNPRKPDQQPQRRWDASTPRLSLHRNRSATQAKRSQRSRTYRSRSGRPAGSSEIPAPARRGARLVDFRYQSPLRHHALPAETPAPCGAGCCAIPELLTSLRTRVANEVGHTPCRVGLHARRDVLMDVLGDPCRRVSQNLRDDLGRDVLEERQCGPGVACAVECDRGEFASATSRSKRQLTVAGFITVSGPRCTLRQGPFA